MKRISLLALTLLLCFGGVQVALAQPPGGGFGRMMGGMGGGGLMLLGMPEVQKELKMTPAQTEKAKAKQDEVRKATQEAFQKAGGFQALRDMSEEDRTKLFGSIQDLQKKALDEILTDPAQKKRHRQLELQQAGSGALMMKDVQESLKINDEQKEKIGEIQMAQGAAMREVFQSLGVSPQDMTDDDRKKMGEKMAVVRKETMTKCVAVLTADQAKQWKEMTGEPFKFPPMRGFGGGGRPPRA